jgi:hypothetical protein
VVPNHIERDDDTDGRPGHSEDNAKAFAQDFANDSQEDPGVTPEKVVEGTTEEGPSKSKPKTEHYIIKH